ncbi:MAG: MFS transporter [Acidobacteria bacterium]|nr:MFS transporter [Acidobacteriota bacterium]
MDKYGSNIWKMYADALFFNMHFIAAVLVPFFTDWGGISFSRVLLLNTWYMFCVFAFEIPTGTVADFFGRKTSMLMGSIVSILAVLVYVSYPNFYVFMAGETIWAVAFTLKSGANEALVYDSLKMIGQEAKSQKVFAQLESFKMAGILTGALLGGVLAKFGGLRLPLLGMIVPFAISGVIVAMLREPPAGEKSAKVSYTRVLKGGIEFFAHHRILKILTLDMVAISSFAFLIIWAYQMLLKDAGIDIIYFGVVHAMMCLAQIVIQQSFSRFEQYLGQKRRLLVATALAAGIGFICLGLIGSAWVIVFLIVATAGFGLSRTPLYISYMNKFIPSDRRATVLSVTSMARNIGIGIANLVAAAVAKWSLKYMMIFSGVIIIFFALATRVKEEHLTE